jgi:hypothetical protein
MSRLASLFLVALAPLVSSPEAPAQSKPADPAASAGTSASDTGERIKEGAARVGEKIKEAAADAWEAGKAAVAAGADKLHERQAARQRATGADGKSAAGR